MSHRQRGLVPGVQPMLGGLEPPIAEFVPGATVSGRHRILEREPLDAIGDLTPRGSDPRSNPPVFQQLERVGRRHFRHRPITELSQHETGCVP